MVNRFKLLSTVVLTAMLFLTACSGKKITTTKAPSAPPPVAPTATLAATPNVIEQGQSTTLSWQTTDATEITIAGLGTVPASGTRAVAPGSNAAVFQLTLSTPATGAVTVAFHTVAGTADASDFTPTSGSWLNLVERLFAE